MEKKTKKELSKKQRKCCSGGSREFAKSMAPKPPIPEPIRYGVSEKKCVTIDIAIANTQNLLSDLRKLGRGFAAAGK